MARDRAMTAVGAAKEACANWRGGACLGADARSSFCMPLPGCLIAAGLGCRYFESCVLPSVRVLVGGGATEADYARHTLGKVRQLSLIHDEGERAAEARLRSHPFFGHGRAFARRQRAERLCECGEPLAPRKRVCPACALKRRRQGYRREKARQREESANGGTSAPVGRARASPARSGGAHTG